MEKHSSPAGVPLFQALAVRPETLAWEGDCSVEWRCIGGEMCLHEECAGKYKQSVETQVEALCDALEMVQVVMHCVSVGVLIGVT